VTPLTADTANEKIRPAQWFSVAAYGSESWTLKAADKKRLAAF